MMQRAGHLTNDDLQRLQAAVRERQLPVIDAILRLGYSDEANLVSFLQSKLSIPVANNSVLQFVDAQLAMHLSPEIAWEHCVLPVSRDDGGNITVAMADPTDLRAVDAVTSHTQGYLIRAVSPLTPLRAAVARLYGPDPLGTGTLPGGLPANATPEREMVETLTPPLGIRANAPTSAFSPAALEAILPSLKVATDRHQITGAALEFLARGFARVIMFVNLHDQLRGHDGRGQDLVVDAIKQARIPTSGESMFADAIARRTPYLGPWPHERPIDKVFAKALGGIEGNVLLLPVTLSGKVPIILFACGSREQGDVSTFIRLSEAISHAIQRLLVRRKSGKAG